MSLTPLTTTEKRLFGELINYNNTNDFKFTFVVENFVILVPKNNEMAKCIKKVEGEWEYKLVDAKKALQLFNITYKDEVSEEESSSNDGKTQVFKYFFL
jgi:hypothetical protein